LQQTIGNIEGRKLIRSFTDELTGKTTLERAAKSIQQEDDAIAQADIEARTRGLFDDGPVK
jgi:hypothetical protein